MSEPTPPNPNQQPDISWFAPQLIRLEHAVNSRSDTTGFSNNLLRLIHNRPNISPDAQTEQLSDVYRLILLEEAVKELHGSLSVPSREAFARDIVNELAAPDEDLPEYAQWLKSVPASQKALLIEALQAKLPELADLPDLNDTMAVELAATPPPADGFEQELAALHAGSLTPAREEPALDDTRPGVPEASEKDEEPEMSDEESEFRKALAECQDATTLRILLEDRADRIQQAIRQRAQEAQEAVKLLDNNDSEVLEKAEGLIEARELSAARKLIKEQASSSAKYQQLTIAIQDKEVDAILSLIKSGKKFYWSNLVDSIDGLDIPEASRAELRALIDPYILKSIEWRAETDDPIDQEDALAFLPYLSDPTIITKVKEIFDLQKLENHGMPNPVQEPISDMEKWLDGQRWTIDFFTRQRLEYIAIYEQQLAMLEKQKLENPSSPRAFRYRSSYFRNTGRELKEGLDRHLEQLDRDIAEVQTRIDQRLGTSKTDNAAGVITQSDEGISSERQDFNTYINSHEGMIQQYKNDIRREMKERPDGLKAALRQRKLLKKCIKDLQGDIRRAKKDLLPQVGLYESRLGSSDSRLRK